MRWVLMMENFSVTLNWIPQRLILNFNWMFADCPGLTLSCTRHLISLQVCQLSEKSWSFDSVCLVLSWVLCLHNDSSIASLALMVVSTMMQLRCLRKIVVVKSGPGLSCQNANFSQMFKLWLISLVACTFLSLQFPEKSKHVTEKEAIQSEMYNQAGAS